MASKAAVLMSGGVDSSAAALLLARQGGDVTGITARLWDDGSDSDGADTEIARQVCSALGIRHVVLDLRERFAQIVVGFFRAEYLRGLTPNPCSVCNRDIKFGLLFDAAMDCGCDIVATGHYAGLGEYEGRTLIREPAESEKSQTYFLALVRPEVLGRLAFPLEKTSKDEARALLSARGLDARQGESQDLCFVTSGRYEGLLTDGVGGRDSAQLGRLLDPDGNVVGTHRGHFAYTVGQKLGHHGRRTYVIEKRPGTNEVVVGDRDRAMMSRINVGEANWFADPRGGAGGRVAVKFRYNTPATPGRISGLRDGGFEVITDEPCFSPAPGQVLACYRDGFLLGGGVIERAGP
ncbi:MAG: tRNA 2-thiouridine(34) synthase MnmA [bacterium]|jgi:tRNA-specific 2-thiouridylase